MSSNAFDTYSVPENLHH